jgi:hypothetical protein
VLPTGPILVPSVPSKTSVVADNFGSQFRSQASPITMEGLAKTVVASVTVVKLLLPVTPLEFCGGKLLFVEPTAMLLLNETLR